MSEDRTVPSLRLLSAREREAVSLLAEGLSDKEIARRMGLSLGTVKVHFKTARRHLGRSLAVRSRVNLAKWWWTQRGALFPGSSVGER